MILEYITPFFTKLWSCQLFPSLLVRVVLDSNVVIAILENNTLIAMPKKLPKKACRDRDDIKVLGLAVATEADYIITGDQNLLCLEKFQSISIVSLRAFWDVLKKRKH
jgi:predicted nucleic acid-binding protein